MRWPWRKRAPEDDQLQEARDRLGRVRAQWPRVKEAAETMHAHRRRNHFAESIAHIYRGERP